MKKKWKMILGICFCILLGIGSGILFAGCGKKENTKVFDAFIATSGTSLPPDNRIRNVIAEKIGAKAELNYLSGQTDKEYINALIQKGEYPDFIDGMDATSMLVEAGVFVPLDDYLDDYPNLKGLFTEQEWERLRQKYGHIYYIPQFSKVNEKETRVEHPDEAFWIQKRVLKWAGYPKLQTVDEYFDLIENYLTAHPDENAVGFEILCDGWRYFCLENVPQFLAGYPNDGCCIVDRETEKVSVYDTIPEAKAYFNKLSEEYDKGIIKANTFTQSYAQYLRDLSSGNVLGIIDQHWQFQEAENILIENGMDDRTYVPFGLTIDKDVEGEYCSNLAFNISNGIGITVSCEDVEGALSFMNSLLEPEILTLCYWGEEGIDYEVDENGVFYRTEEQRKHAADMLWVNENLCSYYYFPHYGGMMKDGINTVKPEEQPGEFYSRLNALDREIMDAYGYQKWTDFSNCAKENSIWFPLYTATNTWTADTDYGKAREKMAEIKREWLPKIILAPEKEFEDLWAEYMKTYQENVDIEAYETELEKEISRRKGEQ